MREDEELRFGVGRDEILELGRDVGAGAVSVKFTFIEVLSGGPGWMKLLQGRDFRGNQRCLQMEIWAEEGVQRTEAEAVVVLGGGPRMDCISEAETGKRASNQGRAGSIAPEKPSFSRGEVLGCRD